MEMSNIDNKLITIKHKLAFFKYVLIFEHLLSFHKHLIKNTALKHKKSLKYTLISKLLLTFIINLTLAFLKFLIHNFLFSDRIPL